MATSRNSFTILDQDADRFFLELSREIGIGTPTAVRFPLTRFSNTLKNLSKSAHDHVDIEAEIRRSNSLLKALTDTYDQFVKSNSVEEVVSDVRALRLSGDAKEAYQLAMSYRNAFEADGRLSRQLRLEVAIAAQGYAMQLANVNLHEAIRIYELAAAECSAMLAEAPDSEIRQTFSSVLTELGDCQMDVGDVGGALKTYQAALELDRAIASENPGDTMARSNVGVDLYSISDVFAAQGNLEEARQHATASVEIFEELVKTDPASESNQIGLSVAYDKAGDSLRSGGRLKEARTYYEKAFDVDAQLASQDPDDEESQRSLMVAHEKLGNILRDDGDIEAALSRHQASLEIAESLSLSSPSSPAAKRDVYLSLQKIGELHLEADRLTLAMEMLNRGLALAEEVDSSGWGMEIAKYDLIALLVSCGRTKRRQNLESEARPILERAVRLATDLPTSEDYNSWGDQAEAFSEFGDLIGQAGDTRRARRYLMRAVELHKAQLVRNPSNVAIRWDLARVMDRLGQTLEQSKDLDGASKAYEQALELLQTLCDESPEDQEYSVYRDALERKLARLKG